MTESEKLTEARRIASVLVHVCAMETKSAGIGIAALQLAGAAFAVAASVSKDRYVDVLDLSLRTFEEWTGQREAMETMFNHQRGEVP